jgi:hypothetical protein
MVGKKLAVDLGGVLRASDALMFVKRSRACLSLTVRRFSGEGVVDLSSHVAFQAAHDLAGGYGRIWGMRWEAAYPR